MQEILNNLEGMEIDEAAAEVNDAEWPMGKSPVQNQPFLLDGQHDALQNIPE